MRYFEITLPLPTSINAAHTVGAGFYDRKNRKFQRVKTRSPELNTWLEYAAIAWRRQYPARIKELFTGRIRLDLTFVWSEEHRGAATSDLDNRIKVLQDFLQGKFFDNDNQIDEIHAFRRIGTGESHVRVRITEIPDRRLISQPPEA